MSMCIRCGNVEAPEQLGYCTTCVIHTRVEVSGGMRRFGQYLAAWAAFDDWCDSEGGDDPAPG
jgi:hypothetical protein